MSLFRELVESLLMESGTLSKGSQRVMSNKNLVAGLADSVKDDVASNPSAFPAGSKANFRNATDEAIAQWFLENIDRIEREGYDGVVYSRDGVNSDWIVRRYIAGSHSWEDLTGVMNMNLSDWYNLKNRNLLDTNHKDLPKFNSVRDVGFYMTTHYNADIEKARDASKNAARAKKSSYVKLVDNEDYRIYTTLNRAAGCALGLGTQWCTANSTSGTYYHIYSNRNMLFQLFPYAAEPNADGKKVSDETQKYQFDAGGEGRPTFMDITDRAVSAAAVQEKYPYIFTDLVAGLNKNKSKLEKAFKDLAADATMQDDDFKIKQYDIDQEIQKLHSFVDTGYFTDRARNSGADADSQINKDTPPQENTMETIKKLAKNMLGEKTLGHIVQQYKPTGDAGEDSPLTYGEENIGEAEFAGGGLEEAKAKLIQTLSTRQGTVQEDDMMQDMEQGNQAQTGGTLGAGGMGSSSGGQYPPGTAPTMPESINHQGKITMKDNNSAVTPGYVKYEQMKDKIASVLIKLYNQGRDEETIKQMGDRVAAHLGYNPEDPTFEEAWLMSLTDASVDGKLDQANDEDDYTDYTMRQGEMGRNESTINHQGKTTMENIDKDVAAMLNSLKKYDKLNESVLGMVTVGMANAKVVKEAGPKKSEVPAFLRKEKGGDDWKVSKADLDKEANSSPTTKKGLADKKAEKGIKEEGNFFKNKNLPGDKQLGAPPEEVNIEEDDKVKEGVDPEIMAWMSRFAKLGNMKGYGR
jgi:hypothetical protein